MKHKFCTLLAAVCIAALLCPTVFAADKTSEYCFAASDFVTEAADLDGIYLSEVPDSRMGTIYLGSRSLRAGDVIPSHQLSQLILRSHVEQAVETSVVFCAIADGHVEDATELKISLAASKNYAPIAKNSGFETYKNIANTGDLKVTDPDGDTLTYTVTKKPKRGTVELHEDGTFTYTPNKNKVGKDSFTFTATDSAGNTSNKATVSIVIMKPSDRVTYSDMTGQDGAFLAVWMKEKGLLLGETVAGNLCFNPEKTVTRGEFLVMTMKLLGANPKDTSLTTGFVDEAQTPNWMQPYLVTALKNGMINGVTTQQGLVFRPLQAVTKAESAVMLQNILELPGTKDAPVFGTDSTVPAWAESSYSALMCAGIQLDPEFSSDYLTRQEAADMLYQIAKLLESDKSISLPWK